MTMRTLKDYDVPYVLKTAAPTTADNSYAVPTMWINTSAGTAYLLVSVTAGVADWFKVESGTALTFAADIKRDGFVDRSESTLSFNATTFTLTLTDAGSGWSYYRDGVKYTMSGNKTKALTGSPPSTDTYYFYIDDALGTITYSTTPWTFTSSKVFVAILLWDNSLTPKYHLIDERHTCLIDRKLHEYLHETRGTQLESLGTVADYVIPVAAPSGDDDNTFSVGESVIYDEDISHTIAALSDPDGATPAYNVFYRTAATTWVWEYANVPFDFTASGYINYDNAGTMTQGTSGKWYNSYLLVTPFGFAIIPGRDQFDSLAEAQAEDPATFTFTGFEISESVIVKQFTWKTLSSYTTLGKCKLAAEPETMSTSVTSAVVTVPGVGTIAVQDADNVSITGGEITGITNFSLTDATDTHIIKAVQEPGLGGRLTIGLDETARTLVLCDIGDIDTDLGLSAAANPLFGIFNADGTSYLSLANGAITGYVGSALTITGGTTLNLRGNNIDRNAGDWVNVNSGVGVELTDTDGEQSWLYVEPKVNQSGTAGYNGLKIKVTETALGTAAAATDSLSNNLILAGTSTDPDKFKVDNLGNVTGANGTFTPVISKGPAIINAGFVGTVTAAASTTVTFSSAADAILAGYHATNPVLGTTLISNALTRYIQSWTNSTTCVVDSSVTWAGTAITSAQGPIATFVDSSGVVAGYILASKAIYIGADGMFSGKGIFASSTMPTAERLGIINIYAASPSLLFDYLGGFSATRRILLKNSLGASANKLDFEVYDSSNLLSLLMLSLDAGGGNIGIGTDTYGTSAAKVIAQVVGTAPTTSPASMAQMWVEDLGGTADKATFHGRDEEGNVFALGMSSITAGSGTGITVNQNGKINQQVYKVTTTYAAYSDSDTTKGVVIATLPAKTKIVGCYADTTAAYTGGAVSAATLEVGITAEGAAEIIAAHNVFSAAITKGLADADMGTSMTRAAAIQGGYLPSWTGTTAIYATIDTTDGNTNALTAGSTTFYIVTERY